MQTKFSILIANYNNENFFEDCYQSLLAQTYPDWEAVIVDDASTDNSVEIIKALINKDERFRLYRNNENKGCGYTKRRCVEMATGEMCGFLDPDDVLLPHALEKMHDASERNPGFVLFHSSLFFCDLKLNKQDPYPHAAPVDNDDIAFLNFNNAVTAFSVFSRKHYLATDGIDVFMQRAVDQDLYLKMFETGKFHFINEPLYLYRRHDGGISSFGNASKARLWHVFAAMQAAKRRNLSLEEHFFDAFISKKDKERLKKIETGNADGRFYLRLLKKKIKNKLLKK